LHRRLQALANRGAPVLRKMGSQYLVLAQKQPIDRDPAQILHGRRETVSFRHA